MRPDRDLQEWALRGLSGLVLEPQYVEPWRPRDGLIVYADGTEWNPGSGAGLYQYRAGVWTFIA
jgi:hypothetical protein